MQALFDFYCDILTYDDDNESGVSGFVSKEVYSKKVSRFHSEIPAKMSAKNLLMPCIMHLKDKQNPTLALGHVKPGRKVVLFEVDLTDVEVDLDIKDKLIVFSNH